MVGFRNFTEEVSAKWKDWKGYDLETVEGDIRNAPFVGKRGPYQPFWALWGFKCRQRPWKRQKIFNRFDYLIIMTSVIPGLWMDRFFQSIIELGAAHIFQVFIFVIFLSIALIYAECFIGDYTKRSACYIWNVMPITYSFMFIQLASVTAECQQGSIKTMVYFQRFIHHLFLRKEWNECPELHLTEYRCFDDEVDALSTRCTAGDVWVVCPDKTVYILPTHYYYLHECSRQSLKSAELIVYLIIHWIVVASVASRGLTRYIRTIQWSHIIVICLYLIILFYLLVVCGRSARKSISMMSALNAAPLGSFRAWLIAFQVAVNLSSWSMMTYCSLASGLVFRTSRWMDSLFLVTVAVVVVTFFAAVRFGFLGCLAECLNTRIETIWKPKGVMYTDAIIPYYFRKKTFGAIFTALLHFTNFSLHIWTYVAMVDALVYGVAELADMLDWQSTLLIIYVAISLPISLVLLYFTECDLMYDSPLRSAFQTLKFINMTLFAITLFWLYGAKTLDEDHFFMYGYRPLGFISFIWPWIPAIFIVVLGGDFYLNALDNRKKLLACLSVHIICIFSIVIGVCVIILRQRKEKYPMRDLIKPLFTWGPPNGPLRRARKRFKPHSALSTEEDNFYGGVVNKRRSHFLGQDFKRDPTIDLEASRWKRMPSAMPARFHLASIHADAATRAMVYAEDVNFFELARANFDDTMDEPLGTLPRAPSAVLVDEEDQLEMQSRESGVQYLDVSPVDVQGMEEEMAEGVTAESPSPEPVSPTKEDAVLTREDLTTTDSEPKISTSVLIEQTMSAPEIHGPGEDARRRAQIAQDTALRRLAQDPE